jgi:hypothetical protein
VSYGADTDKLKPHNVGTEGHVVACALRIREVRDLIHRMGAAMIRYGFVVSEVLEIAGLYFKRGHGRHCVRLFSISPLQLSSRLTSRIAYNL